MRNSQEVVEAVVQVMTPEEATWAACAANLTHGQGYSLKEKRNVLRAYIKAKKHKQGGRIVKSYRDISTNLGIKMTTLYRWMEKDHKSTFRAMQKDTPDRPHAEPPVIDHDPENMRRAQQALRDALDYCNALASPELRFDLIFEAGRVVEQMRLKENQEAGW